MSCADIPTWYLQNRIPVLDARSPTWRRVRSELLPSGYETATCLRRLAAAGRIRRLARGRWQVVDPAREPPSIAIAHALFRDVAHYITTDAALVAAGLIDQPTPLITVVTRRRMAPLTIGTSTIRAVSLAAGHLKAADAFVTIRDGYEIRLASPPQAIVDALAEPRWMTHATLIPEVLAQMHRDDIAAAAVNTLGRSKAAAARLGFLLEEERIPLPQSLEAFRPTSRTELRPGRRGVYSTRWRVYG